jgi:hypothetical protein
LEQTWTTAVEYFRAFDLTHVSYFYFQGPDFSSDHNVMLSTIPESWVQLYRENEAQLTDAFYTHCCNTLEGANTDLEGLVLFDSNANGLLDSGDAQWNQFVVWQDVNRDGTSDSGELRGLSELGIASISLASEAVKAPAVVDGSVFEHGVSTFSLTTGAGGAVGDVAFVYEDVTAYQILP